MKTAARLLVFTLSTTIAVAALLGAPGSAGARTAAPAPRTHDLATDLPFVPNQGQFDAVVAFRTGTFTGPAFVSRSGDLVYAMPAPPDGKLQGSWSLVEHFDGGRAAPAGAVAALPRVSFLTARDADGDSSDLPTFREITLGEVWPGVRIALRAEKRNVEKIFLVAPGGDVGDIRVRLRGAQSIALGADGSLIVGTGFGPVSLAAPFAFQEIDGERVPVAVKYTVDKSGYGFVVGDHDRSQPLVIDPIIQSTFLGSSSLSAGIDETVEDLQVHPATGDIFVVGTSIGADFPGTAGGYQAASGGGSDVYVARLSADLRTLIRATYLGGGGTDLGKGMHLTDTDVYVTGTTGSTNFPTTAGAAQPTNPTPSSDGFVARLPIALTSLGASSIYSAVAGAERTDLVDVLVHPSGDVYACGASFNSALPGTSGSAVQSLPGGSTSSAIVVRWAADLSLIQRSTFHGDNTACRSMAVLPTSGEIVAVGTGTGAPPNTTGSAFPSIGGTQRGWISKYSADLSQLPISSYVIGGGQAATVRIHPGNGGIYVFAYQTISGSVLPPNALTNAAQATCGGDFGCASVLRFSAGLDSVVSGTLYGNGSTTAGSSIIARGDNALAIDPASGDVFIGAEAGNGMPNATSGFIASLPSGLTVSSVVVRMSSDLATIRRASYVSGTTNVGNTNIHALALHPLNNDLYIAGRSGNPDLPGLPGGAQPVKSSGEDAFIMRVTADLSAAGANPGVLQFSAPSYTRAENGGIATINVTRTGGSDGAVSVQFAVIAGTAQGSVDYSAQDGVLNWSSGDSTPRSFDVTIIDDTAVETTETVSLSLSSPTGGATLGAQSSATLQITDNDVAPTTPGIALSATTLTYAATTIGATATAQTLTITSSGTGSLVLGAITRGGAQGSEFGIAADNCSNQTLAPNATCSVQVNFTPAAAGARSGTLSVPSNATGSPATVTLAGSGATPPPPSAAGGGGAIDLGALMLLLLATAAALRRPTSPRTAPVRCRSGSAASAHR